ncbi:cytochrome P450 [Aspergillus sclerotiicarbonarius CBS 121057]|uniref:Cytochrome P450 n=1 Tax=Aspergillus sclerotiicarbonarius (strain CBS 121057 / IBT 28362) TaxID=1448318 RepID=A0A319FK27_ASPSB|nr:cytochrome P450 [Aspergillus sclerotiicarbonarius CBS 121057]
MSVQNILLAAGGCATLLILGRLIYLLFLHPLAKFPGPVLARISDAYGAYHAWKGDAHLDMWRMHEQYGDFVRHMPNTLFIRNAEALHAIYSTKAYASVVKSPHYRVLESGSVASTFSLRGGHDHLWRRRIVSTALSEKAQRGMDPRIAVHVRKFCEAVFPARQGSLGEPMNMDEWCGYLSFDLMSDLVFSASYNLLGRDKFRYMPEVIDQSNVRMSVLVYLPLIAAWRAIDGFFFREALIARNRFLRFVVRAVRERADRALGKWAPDALDPCLPRNDIYNVLATARDPDTGKGFTATEMVSESTTLVVAGSDTTSTAISSTLFYLADNRYAYEKAAQEVRVVFAGKPLDSEEVLSGPALSSCTYLQACIDEALRMSPPNGAALTREVLPGGLNVGGVHIPAGVTVAVPLYAIHHDPRYYVEPFSYRPERWLEDDGTGSIKRARLVFSPFSLGMRGCLGRSLAYHEIMTTVATVLYLGDFQFAEGPLGQVGRGVPGASYGRHRENEYQLRDHITGQKDGPWLRFSRREISA